ncbi:hypothetical protein [Denitratisoma sp. DHT3]|uniref:ORC-CDC6 family AAA ATPase n=1 Tax=Denitratisoma sp. DHT3 TaxID=1981880 RepID=UPI0011A2C38B|nr:hypothetical protein [Denitratisoma sp. DHT3]
MIKSSKVFFSAFNARHLDAEKIASHFVPNLNFHQLATLQHALVVGPRGSGKTHLLKMLQPKALACWNHPSADQTRASVGFIGVFIPADEAWKQQITCIAEAIEQPIALRFTDAIFVTHFQRALLDTFLQLTHDRPQQDNGFLHFDVSRERESELCRALANSWNLSPLIYSLLGIKQSLVDRMARLHEVATNSPDQLAHLLSSAQTALVPCASQGIEAFNAMTGQYQGRWGLLFDELEIAPDSVQRMLFSCLRSTDQRLVFKLAISPSASAADVFHSVLGPSAGNDFEEISLYADPKDAQGFCEALWGRLALAADKTSIVQPTAVLGHSVFHAPDVRGTYRRTGAWQRAFSELANKDPSFQEVLSRKGVNANDLEKVPPELMDAVVRKAAPLVGFRNLLIDRGPSRRGEKSVLKKGKKSTAKIYSGWEAVCFISEANPRWFTGIARQLLIERSRGSSGRDISVDKQFRVIQGASQKFQDYITTIPSKVAAPDNSRKGGLRYIVDELTGSFRRSVLEGVFTMDPVMSFEVPEDCDEAVRDAIADGLYSGAFIPIGGLEGRSVFSQVAGVRLRLTHLFAPLALLPLRSASKSRSLATLVKKSPRILERERPKPTQSSNKSEDDPQKGLFDE